MIKRVEVPKLQKPLTEANVRIKGLLKAYKKSQPFLSFWQSGDGAIALLSNAAIVDPVSDKNWHELMLFLNMNPDIKSVRTSKAFAEKMANEFEGWGIKTQAVMTPGKNIKTPRENPEELLPREVYPLLREVFGDNMQEFESWYVDVSHRIRHGAMRIVGFRDTKEVLASAMTVAESDEGALIGAVGTRNVARGKGYASSNVLFLARELEEEGKKVLLSPKNQRAFVLYEKLGFEVHGYWGELQRK